MNVVYTIIQARGFDSFASAGLAIDTHNAAADYAYDYRPKYISKGIVVQVYDGSKLQGYLS